MTKRRIGIFGGSFDPPHLGHQQVAKALVQERIVDEVWFVPVKQHPLGKDVSVEQHRLAMLHILVSTYLSEPTYKVDTTELESEGPSYSLKTLRQLAKMHPNSEFLWIMGSDNLKAFHSWWQHDSLLQEFPVLVYPREGSEKEPWYEGMMWLGQLPTINISSTQVRESIKNGSDISGLVGEEIAQYIKNHDVYR